MGPETICFRVLPDEKYGTQYRTLFAKSGFENFEYSDISGISADFFGIHNMNERKSLRTKNYSFVN